MLLRQLDPRSPRRKKGLYAGAIYWVLCFNECNRACSDEGDSVPYRYFTSISSDVYPDVARHYRRLIDRWVDAYAISESGDEEAEEE